MSIKTNVPELRFGEFSGDWERIKIQKLIDNKFIISHLDGNHGALYPTSSEFATSGIPYISANDFVNGKVDFNNCKYLPEDRAKQFKKGIAHDGDVLFAHNATVGPTALLKTNLDYVILSTTATYFRCNNEKLLNSFLVSYFNTKQFIKQYSRVMYQSTRNQVPITAQRLFYIGLPSKPEQEKIASFLSSVDTKIEQLAKKKALLEQYKKGVMQKIFSQEIRFKDDDGSEYPEWVEKKINNVLKIGSGKDYKHLDKGSIPVYGTGGYMTSVNNYLYDGKSVCIGRKGTINKPMLISGKFWTVDTLFYTHQFKNISPEFFYYLSLTINWLKYNEGTTLPSLSKKTIESIKVTIPKSRKEQTRIANFLSSLDSKISQVEQQLDSTKQFKKALLQKMFV